MSGRSNVKPGTVPQFPTLTLFNRFKSQKILVSCLPSISQKDFKKIVHSVTCVFKQVGTVLWRPGQWQRRTKPGLAKSLQVRLHKHFLLCYESRMVHLDDLTTAAVPFDMS